MRSIGLVVVLALLMIISGPGRATVLAASCDSSYPDFCIPSPPPDLNCDSPEIGGRKNFRVLQPDPHHFDADKDGFGCDSGSTPTPTPTASVAATPTPTFPAATSTPTRTATSAATLAATPAVTPTLQPFGTVWCEPRPPVTLVKTRQPSGDLVILITSSSNSGGISNALKAVTLGSVRNATVSRVSGGPIQAGERLELESLLYAVILSASRTTSGQAISLTLTVTDSCGDWPATVDDQA